MNALFKLIMSSDLKVRPSQRGFKLQKFYCSYRNMFLLPDLELYTNDLNWSIFNGEGDGGKNFGATNLGR